jgi:DNA-binding CsgD family transcriptional regulator
VDRLSDPPSQGSLQGYFAELAIWQGDVGMAGSAVAMALQHIADSEEHNFVIILCHVGLRAEADAAEQARDRRASRSEIEDIHTTGQQLLIRARQALGLLGPGTSFPEARAHAVGCEAEFARMKLRSDPRRWAALAAIWDGLSRPYDAAYARWRQAEVLLAARAPRAAVGVLRQAHQVTVELGEGLLRREIERLASRARIDLRQPPIKARGATLPAATEYGLTPREQEVLQRLVEGRTNRQIARTLFISEKTASVHVSNIMSKLGASNRSEAAAIAHRLRLLESNA